MPTVVAYIPGVEKPIEMGEKDFYVRRTETRPLQFSKK